MDKAIHYSTLRKPYIINNIDMQYELQDRRKVYSILKNEGILIPRYAVLDRDSPDPKSKFFFVYINEAVKKRNETLKRKTFFGNFSA